MIFCFALIFGIILARILAVIADALLLCLLAFLCLGLSLAYRNFLRLCFALIAGVCIGYARQVVILQDQARLAAYYGQEITLSGILVEDATEREAQLRLRISNLSLNYSTNIKNCQVYIILADTSINTVLDLRRSDRITLRGKLSRGFGEYAGFIYRPDFVSLGKPSPPDFANQLKQRFTENIQSLFAPEISSLALGYLVGDKSGMSEDFTEQLRLAGLSHLVVTSGFHLSILLSAVRKVFGKISRAAIILGTLALVLAFISVTGFSASMARASLMSLLALLAWYFGRKFHPVRLFFYVVALTLLINPYNLQNVGWQLSFAAYFGIIFFAPVLAKYLYGRAKPSFLTSAFLVSLSAQLFCLPISIYNFGMFSVAGLVLGLIISPTIALVMALTLLSGTFLLFVAKLAIPIIQIHLALIGFAAQIPWASFTLPVGNATVLLTYLPLIALLLILKQRSHYDFRPHAALAKSQKYGKIYAC